MSRKKLFSIFFPYATQRQYYANQHNLRFVHYTRAETAMSIIKHKQIWMRNATCMNDYMEIQYGLNCLNSAYESAAGQVFRQMINNLFPNICEEIAPMFASWVNNMKYDTYLTCISEHLGSEDNNGRLSMWRAYGRDSGVALILKNSPFLSDFDALKAYTSPVAYFYQQNVEKEFRNITENIINDAEFLKAQDREIIKNLIFNAFRFAALCIKHPAFEEEREWRITYSPSMEEPSDYITKDIYSVNGTPQRIYKIPLKKITDGFDISISGLLDRIIIGPTEYSLALQSAFIDLLTEAGVADPEKKTFVSNIPLRR